MLFRTFAPLRNCLIQPRRLFQWLDAQFFFQHARQFLVLPQRDDALICLRVQLHQMPMRRLMQWIEREPAPRVHDRVIEFALRGVMADEFFERTGQVAAERLGLKELPPGLSRSIKPAMQSSR